MTLTILHLSDIHIHSPSDSILRQASQIASACFTVARNSDACLILVTGDIAYGGESFQYDEAKLFLSNIKKEIQKEGCSVVDIITVPGNHDCLLKPENRSRSVIIETIINEPEEAANEDIIKTCTEPQKAYFDFQSQITEKEPIFKHVLWNEYEFPIKDKYLRISAINAAWMSRIPEQPGQLVFPIELFREKLVDTKDLRLVLLHHPLNWYCQQSYHPLRQSLRTYANIIFSGHEHLSSSGTIIDTNIGSSHYFEAAALQPHEKSMKPSFSVFYVSFDDNNIDEFRYTIEVDNILENSRFSHILFDEKQQVNGNYQLIKDFQNILADPGGNFVHPEKDNIDLDDIYIYPEVKRMDAVTINDNSFISVEKILFQDHINLRILFLGEEKSGKTSLLLRIFNQFYSSGLLPLYIKAHELSSSSEREIEKFIEKQIKQQYTNPTILNLAEKERKIAIVDDIDKVGSGSKTLYSLIQYLERQFTGVILSANVEFELTNLINKDTSNSLAIYETYEIQRFSLRLRHQLIKKWCLCGEINSKPELDERIHNIEKLVNTIIGKSLVPSQPIYLLILIQSCQQNQQNELQNSTFAYYYQYIITKSFGEVGVKREELDELFNYLSHFAWFVRKSNSKEIVLKDIKPFNKTFCEEFITVDLSERLKLLCKAKILIKRGDYYSFTYPYIYYYFLGKFLADNLHKNDIKEIVEGYCDNLYKYQNAHAILFLTHHNNNHPWIINRILFALKNCFVDSEAIAFNEDVHTINTLVSSAAHLFIEEPDVDKNQEESRKIVGELEDDNHKNEEDNYEIEEQVSFASKITLLMRTAEILGQILKNYYGSIERPLKKELINEIFVSPLRLLGSVFENVVNDPFSLVKELESHIEKDHPHLSIEKKEDIARRFVFHLLNFISTGLILRTAQFVSSSKLQEDISIVVSDGKTNAYKLIEIAIHLSQPGHLPFDDIRKFSTELKEVDSTPKCNPSAHAASCNMSAKNTV